MLPFLVIKKSNKKLNMLQKHLVTENRVVSKKKLRNT